MSTEFLLPAGLIGKFAVVKLWPGIQTAEDECIARLKIASQSLGVECVEIGADGNFLKAPKIKVSNENVDFVIHLHYDTPKQYDAFSFVALWNPLKFYHEWGYRRCSRNLTTHDDFISCSSDAADHHVARMIHKSGSHLVPLFNLYHSTADVVFAPSLGEQKLFYAGINWEAISGGVSRHQEVLKRLDKTGLLSIYGPEVFQGVRVWAGYDSYVKEIPFDGVSMLAEISKAGVALVLSSPAHKESALMSNRLFESVAAGALVICDENPFAKKFFGGALLYIDGRSPVEKILTDIVGHLEWARAHPEEVLAMIGKAQEIFRGRFSLSRNLADIYRGFPDRKKALAERLQPALSSSIKVRLNMLMPSYSDPILQGHIKSVVVQEYENLSACLVVDKELPPQCKRDIQLAVSKSSAAIEVVEVDFLSYGVDRNIKVRKRLGEIIVELIALSRRDAADAFMVVAPNESLFSNHLSVLAGALKRDANVNCAATAAILSDGDNPIHDVHEVIDFGHVNRRGPSGYGRFIFRLSAMPDNIEIAMPYLDGRPLAVLVADNTINQQLPATITIDLQKEFPARTWDDAAENEIIRDYSPDAFKLAVGFDRRVEIQLPVVGASGQRFKGLKLLSMLANRQWVRAQFEALRKQGFTARVQTLKRRLSS